MGDESNTVQQTASHRPHKQTAARQKTGQHTHSNTLVTVQCKILNYKYKSSKYKYILISRKVFQNENTHYAPKGHLWAVY